MVPHSTAPRQVKVLLPVNVDHPFDYLRTQDMAVTPGDYVMVPFGHKHICGVVWEGSPQPLPRDKLKTIHRVIHAVPPMREDMQRYLTWVSRYTCASLGNVLKLCLSVPEAITKPPQMAFYRKHSPLPNGIRLTSARQALLDMLPQEEAMSLSQLEERAIFSRDVLRGLIKSGAVAEEMRTQESLPASELKPQKPELSAEQLDAALKLCQRIGKGFAVDVLDGVTGSGKTEVYFEAIEAALVLGRQALVMLPEIALSVQWLKRCEKRFGIAAHAWHSGLGPAQRKATWRAVANGQAQLVVGARSALFLPFQQLELIIVDEEHDASYKQEDGVIYHGRDMAVARAHAADIPVILASATPSLETVENCDNGKYRRHILHARYGSAELPGVTRIDMRAEKLPATQWLSAPMKSAIATTLENGNQTLLFLNRRGYAPLLLCRACGHRFQCSHCSTWLVTHRQKHQLQCHHCGHMEPSPSSCPECGAGEDKLAPCGPGIERVAEETLQAFPGARLLVLSSETLTNKTELERAIRQIEEGEADIVIGTQLLAKGHHFPGLALVGIVDGDLGLGGGDFRAAERTYQLLHQLSGRAGRAEVAGQVLLQTYQPEHPVMLALASGDRDGFIAMEKKVRAEYGLPPFGRLAALIVESKNENALTQAGRMLARSAPAYETVSILGPAPAPLYKLRDKYRLRFLVKTPRDVSVQQIMREWTGGISLPSSVVCKIDIDPYSFL